MSSETREQLISALSAQPYIPSVLILENGKTYGRTANKKRLLYKCVPNDRQYPSFLVPYEITLGFSKSILNKYVLIRFDSWTQERPHGLLTEVLGDVSKKDVYIEYQFYCRKLRHTIAPFIRIMRDTLSQKPSEQIIDEIYAVAEYRIAPPYVPAHIFTIDPDNSTDLDDGFSLARSVETGNTVVSVYIANVFVWIDYLGLWSAFSNRVSTIYLPDRKVPLLPPILSDTLCSLLENERRFAVVMDVEVSPSGKILYDTATFRNQLIRVSKNYRYESTELLRDSEYMELLRISRLVDPTIRDSHDVVAFWMIQMNIICGSRLYQNHCGIFRAEQNIENAKPTTPNVPRFDDETITRFLHNWKHTSCTYIPYEDALNSRDYYHSGLDTNTYAHITSPIRRLVDILNQTLFVISMIINGSSRVITYEDTSSPSALPTISQTPMLLRNSSVLTDAFSFCERWVSQIKQLNDDMKSIRKLQSDCELLYLCERDPETMNKVYSGILLEKHIRDDATFSYTVYLTELKIVSRVSTITDYSEYAKCEFRLVWFSNEDNIRDKIRLQIV
jgi:exoribonuclease R